MLHLIPAWYSKNEWKESEQFWYIRLSQVETDDTIKQIQLFQRNRIYDYDVLVLSFAPNLRHFLHRHSVYRAPYWSVFDAMQGIRKKKHVVFSFHNLKWPEDVEFIYSDFCVIAMIDGQKYAQIEFGEYGNLIQVDLYKDGQVIRKNVYDDRGFVSLTSLYENGEKKYDQYLNENGVWKLCHFPDGHVVINESDNEYIIDDNKIPYSKRVYSSMDEVIEEVTKMYFSVLQNNDVFCVAVHEQHLNMMSRILPAKNTIFSVFENRAKLESLVPELSKCRYIVTDSEENHKRIVDEQILSGCRVVSIPPYDTRLDVGISQQLHVQKILLPVDDLTDNNFVSVIEAIIPYLQKNEKARVHLFTRNDRYDSEDILLQKTRAVLEKNNYPAAWARKAEQNRFEFILDEEDKLPILFVVEKCLDELSVAKCVREQRILVDLADVPDMFLQISCVSMGVPQILKEENRYMRNGQNGRVNHSLSDLEEDIRFYLESLSNWNDAMISAYELGKTYSTQQLIDQWREVITEIEEDSSITAG